MKSIAILLAAVSTTAVAAFAPKDIPAIIEQADRVEIVETDFSKGGRGVRRSEIPPQAAAELGAILADSAPTDGCCMCAGNPVIEILKNGAPTKTITIHHWLTIRIRGTKLNAKVGSPERLAEWLAHNGSENIRKKIHTTRRAREIAPHTTAMEKNRLANADAFAIIANYETFSTNSFDCPRNRSLFGKRRSPEKIPKVQCRSGSG